MARTLHLWEDGPNDGIANMARDRAMLDSATAGEASLRLYRWHPQWVSLGRNQATIPGISFQVRRPTGGRAVLHGDDITVAVAIPLPLAGVHHFALRPIYSLLMAPLLAALQSCGLPVQLGAEKEGSERPARTDCFATTGRFDICLQTNYSKVGGAALYTCETAALLQVSILVRDSGGLGPFPARQVPPWNEDDLGSQLRAEWQTLGWQVEPVAELL